MEKNVYYFVYFRSLDTLDYIYKRPYTRISPYLVGIVLAFYLHRRKLSGCGKNSLVSHTCVHANLYGL